MLIFSWYRANTSVSNKTQNEISDQTNTENSVYLNYSKDLFDTALNENKIILLYFTSNWCQECFMQEDIIRKVFDSLKDIEMVGFRVHILDSETTEETDLLAKKYDISSEQTTLVLKSGGSVSFKIKGVVEEEDLKSKIIGIVAK